MSNKRNQEKNYLKRYRLMFGYSQREVAKKLGIDSTTMISRWERGDAYPDLKNLLKLSIIYKTLIDQLYSELRQSVIQEMALKDIRIQNDINAP